MRLLVWVTLSCLVLVVNVNQALAQLRGTVLQCEHERRPGDRVGRRCKRACGINSYCGPRKECVCDGKCGKSCINPDQKCAPTPKNITNGRVKITPYNKFGAIATYSCKEGYTLVGLPARVCQGDETWLGEPPRCELDHDIHRADESCGPPPRVSHATHSGKPGQRQFHLGAKVTYACDNGYVLHKDSVTGAWCVTGGFWVGPNITCQTENDGCEQPRNIRNGYPRLLTLNSEGGRVQYTCEKGFVLVGDEFRVCQRNGSWSGVEPRCTKVVCGPPPELEHADHNAPKNQIRFEGGATLIYNCKFGFFKDGSERAICNGATGSWSGPKMSCRARDCGDPGTIENARRADGYRFTFPDKVHYYCNDGYEMQGVGYRQCQANGEWTADKPKCKPVECPELTPPTHGTMVGSDTTYGTKINFLCSNGYKVVGSRERVCRSDHTWSGQEAICEEINCGMPDPVWNGYLDGHRTNVGGIYFFRCNLRMDFIGTKTSTQCLDNGQWSDPAPLCIGKCEVRAIKNGTFAKAQLGMWVKNGTQIEPVCHDGLVLDDPRPMICNNQTWTVQPSCVPAPCNSPPPHISNGHRVFFSLAHDTRVRYYCVAGYKLVDNHQYMTCKYGSWIGIQPRCREDHCENPGTLENGEVYKVGSRGKFAFHGYIKTIRHGDRLVYECKRNFKLVGPRGAACVNGKWSPTRKPVCVRARHPVFNKLWKPHQESGPGRMYY